MTRRNRWIDALLVLALALFGMSKAAAVGGSGGGCRYNLLDEVVRSGTPIEVERAIEKWLDYSARSLSVFDGVSQYFAAISKSRQQRIANLIEGVHDYQPACAPNPLLLMALDGGNLEVVRFLLGQPMGAKAKVLPNILFLYAPCRHGYPVDDALRARRRDAMALLLTTGAVDVNARNDFGLTILQTCYQPELVTLFIESGARLDVQTSESRGSMNLFDAAVMDALRGPRDGSFDPKHSIARIQILSRVMPNSIRGRRVERAVREACAEVRNGERPYAAPCAALAARVDAAPGTFGE